MKIIYFVPDYLITFPALKSPSSGVPLTYSHYTKIHLMNWLKVTISHTLGARSHDLMLSGVQFLMQRVDIHQCQDGIANKL